MNVTVVPATGLPPASRTLTCSGWGKRLATLVDLCFSGIATILAGTPAAEFVSENETEPYCELAVTV